MKISVAQLLVVDGEPDRNISRAEEMTQEAKIQSCKIILLPECLDLGWTHPSAKTEAQPIPGRYSDRLCIAAKQNDIYIYKYVLA